jgi:hypothetical protein
LIRRDGQVSARTAEHASTIATTHDHFTTLFINRSGSHAMDMPTADTRAVQDSFRPIVRHCEPTGRREAPPDDRLREAIQRLLNADWIASSQGLLAMTEDLTLIPSA